MDYNFSTMASAILRRGDLGVALAVEAHFDESGTSGEEVTLAGYLFERDIIEEFSVEWHKHLDRHNLPFFHMVECAHGNGIFSSTSKADRIRLQMDLMRLIKRFSVNGIVCNIKNNKGNTPKTYSDLVEMAFKEVSAWADLVGQGGNIGFFFEAGASGFGMAEAFFNEIKSNPGNPLYHRYGGHAYIPKEGNAGVQAADFLAWQYNNYTKKRKDLDLPRLDTRALLRHPHRILDLCGDPPTDSKNQSPENSRHDREVIYYLPSISEKQTIGMSVIAPTFDGVSFTRDGGRKIVLACSSCFRAISEGVEIEQLQNIVFRCYCGVHVFCAGHKDLRLLVRPR